jgi:hypothetical protein
VIGIRVTEATEGRRQEKSPIVKIAEIEKFQIWAPFPPSCLRQM